MSRPGVVTPCVRHTVARLGVVRNTEAHFHHFRVAWPLSAGERRPGPENETAMLLAVPGTKSGRACVRIGKWENKYESSRRLSTRRDASDGISLGVWPLRLSKRTGASDLKELAEQNGGEVECLGSVRMKTADGKVLTGWLASQTDMLSDDWVIVE